MNQTITDTHLATHIRFEKLCVSGLLDVGTQQKRAKEQNDGHEEDFVILHETLGTSRPHIPTKQRLGTVTERVVPKRAQSGSIGRIQVPETLQRRELVAIAHMFTRRKDYPLIVWAFKMDLPERLKGQKDKEKANQNCEYLLGEACKEACH